MKTKDKAAESKKKKDNRHKMPEAQRDMAIGTKAYKVAPRQIPLKDEQTVPAQEQGSREAALNVVRDFTDVERVGT